MRMCWIHLLHFVHPIECEKRHSKTWWNFTSYILHVKHKIRLWAVELTKISKISFDAFFSYVIRPSFDKCNVSYYRLITVCDENNTTKKSTQKYSSQTFKIQLKLFLKLVYLTPSSTSSTLRASREEDDLGLVWNWKFFYLIFSSWPTIYKK